MFSNDLRNREVALLFGSVEAGPLAIARLNSSAFSQEALDRLMSTPSLNGRAITKVQIVGGAEKAYTFAQWDSHETVKEGCLVRLEKKFQYQDSIHPFHVFVEYDNCKLLVEEQQIYRISMIGITLVFVLVSIAIILAILPILQSLRASFTSLRSPDSSAQLDNIRFLPLRDVTEMALKSVKLEREAVIANLSRQVAHDIRSPLSALKMALKEVGSLPSDSQAIIRNSLQRINDIANNLLHTNQKNFQEENQLSSELLYLTLDSLLSEKRMQYSDLSHVTWELAFDCDHHLFVEINKVEFHRVLSNLLNNSVEAFSGSGFIRIVVESSENHSVKISLIDNGKGMPKHVLAQLGEKGFSYGKSGGTSGSGLGIYHAKKTITSFNGDFNIHSEEGRGTQIEIVLPVGKTPLWYAGELKNLSSKKIVVVDDDENILRLWKKKLGQVSEYFSNAEQLKKYVTSSREENLYLVDYELAGQIQTGLDLIESLSLTTSAVLVTSRFDEKEIQERCLRLGIKIIPKQMIEWTELKTSKISESFEYVYIDDDNLMRTGWERRAKKNNVKLLTLNSTNEFHSYIDRINKESTAIYIDSHLGEGEIPGEKFAEMLHNNGYKKLFIATGYEAEHFAHLKWLNYAGKECPF